MMQSALLVALASVSLLSPSAVQDAPIAPSVWTMAGAEIPDVELPRVDGGGLVSLASFRGKRLLLIHFASW